MDITSSSPRPVVHNTAELKEAIKRLKIMLAQAEMDAAAGLNRHDPNETPFKHYHSAFNSQNIPYDGLSLSSGQQYANSTSSFVPSIHETPKYIEEPVASGSNEIPFDRYHSAFNQNIPYGCLSLSSDQRYTNSTSSSSSSSSIPKTPEYIEEPVASGSNKIPLERYHPAFNQNIPYGDLSLSSDQQSTDSSSSPSSSIPETPEYIEEQVSNEEIVSPYCSQGDIAQDQDEVSLMESDDAIEPENPPLAPPNHTFAAQPSFAPEYPQNVHDGYKGTNELGEMDHNQVTRMENHKLAQAPTTNNQNILAQQVYQIKHIPVLVPVTNTLNAATPNYIIMSPPTVAPSMMVEQIPNFASGSGVQHHTALGGEGANIYGIRTPDMMLAPTTNAYHPPQEQLQTPTNYHHYSSLSTALSPLYTNQYEQQTWSQ